MISGFFRYIEGFLQKTGPSGAKRQPYGMGKRTQTGTLWHSLRHAAHRHRRFTNVLPQIALLKNAVVHLLSPPFYFAYYNLRKAFSATPKPEILGLRLHRFFCILCGPKFRACHAYNKEMFFDYGASCGSPVQRSTRLFLAALICFKPGLASENLWALAAPGFAGRGAFAPAQSLTLPATRFA